VLTDSASSSKPGGADTRKSSLPRPEGVTQGEVASCFELDKSVSEPELCNAPSSVEKAVAASLSDPEQVVGVSVGFSAAQASQHGADSNMAAGESVGGMKGGRAGGSDIGDFSIGGSDGGVDGGRSGAPAPNIAECHGEAGKLLAKPASNETGVGGAKDAHNESTEGDGGAGVIGVADASQAGGNDACRESLTADGECVGGGGPVACKTSLDIMFGECTSAYPANIDFCKVGGKNGACIGGGGGPDSKATSHETMLGCCAESPPRYIGNRETSACVADGPTSHDIPSASFSFTVFVHMF